MVAQQLLVVAAVDVVVVVDVYDVVSVAYDCILDE